VPATFRATSDRFVKTFTKSAVPGRIIGYNPARPPMSPDPDDEPSLMSGFGWAMGLSAELVVTTLVGLGLGWLVDRGLHTGPVFLIIGSLLGGAGGVRGVYYTWKRRT
jgi:putative F0F1-ATPase subunit (Ca2+/Mg2+ transporter)